MTPEQEEFADLSEPLVRAMDALFAFSAAMNAGDLTLGDLMRVIRLAVKDGHGTLMTQLMMASHAAGAVGEELGTLTTDPKTGRSSAMTAGGC
jgi:hypothetical protein